MAINYQIAMPLQFVMNIEEVFTVKHMMESSNRCLKNVRWKASVQNFEFQMLKNVHLIRKEVLQGTYKSKGFHKFTLRERGKDREIQAPHITERMVQKVLCDFCLIPIFTPKFIYDNGACLKGKGTGFAIKRTKQHLHEFYKRTKSNRGYVLLLDIKSFFNSINHQIIIDMVGKQIDGKLLNLYSYLVNCFDGDAGLGLGSQISQVSAGIYLSGVDHLIKDKLKIKEYGRHMDDCYLMAETKQELRMYLREIESEVNKLKLKLNLKKTQIVPIKNGFTFLKRRFILHDNGKIEVRPSKTNIMRYKKKRKKLLKKDFEAAEQVRKSFVGYLKEFNYYDRYTRRIKNV